jgi:RNA polymerase sigma-70 factor (ECF subfamily)
MLDDRGGPGPDMTIDRDQHLPPEIAVDIERLYRDSGAERWQLEQARFGAALLASARHGLKDLADSDAVSRYLKSLNLPDLALAHACAEGIDAAWDHFVSEFRPRLYAAAMAIAGGNGRELADSIYAELYGLEVRDGRRRSLFEYFHGRSSLLTWLRTVLAQRHVDHTRAQIRLRPMDDAGEPASTELAPDPDRSRYASLLRRALTASLGALGPADRLRLSYYYLQQLRMAEIGRLLGESEATVSRKLDRTRRALRLDVKQRLKHDEHLTDPQVRECLEYATDQWHFDVSGALPGRDT